MVTSRVQVARTARTAAVVPEERTEAARRENASSALRGRATPATRLLLMRWFGTWDIPALRRRPRASRHMGGGDGRLGGLMARLDEEGVP
jgi:hypothetical protein